MITKTITTTTGRLKIHIPDSLDEITLGQMIAMEQAVDTIPLIPELTKEITDNIVDYIELLNIQEHILSLAHKIRYCYNGNAIPEYITIGIIKTFWGVCPNKIKVIKNLSIEPAGAYLASRDLIADEINRHIEIYGEDEWKSNFVPTIDSCAGLLAHYFYCPVTGLPYNEQKAEAFKDRILDLPISVALPIARYFFLKFPDLSKQKITLWQECKQIWKRKQALHRLRNSNIITQ